MNQIRDTSPAKSCLCKISGKSGGSLYEYSAKGMVDDLLGKGWITPEKAHLAQYVSVAEDITSLILAVMRQSGDLGIVPEHCATP